MDDISKLEWFLKRKLLKIIDKAIYEWLLIMLAIYYQDQSRNVNIRENEQKHKIALILYGHPIGNCLATMGAR